MKHHFDKDWVLEPNLTDHAVLSYCTRCGVNVRIGKVGGTKFYVNGKWVSHCPCTGKKDKKP
jgi:hypothetical protein